jgi:hypothetical protein
MDHDDIGDVARKLGPFGIGGRGREFYAKYIDAFKFISKQCGGPQ